jgi:hypothetical protein
MENENTQVQVVQKGGAMSMKQIADRVNLVHQVLEKVMVKGTHYGTVPGCGARMVLLKPGADVLAMTFQLVPQFTVTRTELENGHREYDVTCSMYSAHGVMLGQGVGSGSTMEKKYRYRKDDGGNKIENEDIADVYNTVLKMAKKRAHVDATLTVTGAGDLFTQDLIDEDEQPARAPVAMPKAKQDAPKTATAPGHEVVGIIEDVATFNSKPDAAKPWTKWGVKIDGVSYGTFDANLGAKAVAMKGQTVLLQWKEDGKYKTALDMEAVAGAVPADKPDATPPAETVSGLPL